MDKNRQIHGELIVAALVMLGVSIAMLWSLVDKGQWFYGAQAYRYPYLLTSFREAIDAGIWYPRWLPDLMGGYGYPTFVFYQPGFFFLALPFTYLFGDMVHALIAALLVMLTMGAVGMYLAARQFTHATGAMACGLLFLLTPYIPFMLYARGSLSELLGVLVCPWLFYYALRLQYQWQHGRPAWKSSIGLSVSAAFLILSHPMVAAYAAFSLIFILFCLPAFRSLAFAMLIACCGLLALALSGAYWWPLLQYYDAVSWGTAHRIVTMQWPHLLFLGSGHVLLAAGLLKRNDMWSRRVACWLIGLGLLLSPAGQSIWSHPWVASYTAMLQMTYRVLGVMAVLLLLIIARGFSFRAGRLKVLVLSLAALLISYGTANWAPDFYQHRLPAKIFSYSRAGSLFAPAEMHDKQRLIPGWQDTTWFENSAEFREKIQSGIHNMTHTDEFFPKGAILPKISRFSGAIPYAEGEFLTLVNTQPAPSRMVMQRDIPAGIAAPALRIRQYWFPGWQVMVNNILRPEALRRTKEGLIALDVNAPGKHTITLWYDGPPDWKQRNIYLMLLAIIAMCGMYYIISTRPRQA